MTPHGAVGHAFPPAHVRADAGEIRVGLPGHLLEAFSQQIPLGRPGAPEEAAGAVYLFCSPESDYVSGQVLVAGGGLLV